jgi:hypothetical protein
MRLEIPAPTKAVTFNFDSQTKLWLFGPQTQSCRLFMPQFIFSCSGLLNRKSIDQNSDDLLRPDNSMHNISKDLAVANKKID